MKKIFLLIVALQILCLPPTPVYAAASSQQSEETEFDSAQGSTESLLIFLDNSEEIIDAISGSFLTAFLQEAGPILVSGHTLNLVRTPTNSASFDFNAVQSVSEIPSESEITDENRKLLSDARLAIINFDKQVEDKWIIKKLDASLYLMLPKTYLTQRNVDISHAQANQSTSPGNNITKTEKRLGLKIDHFPTIDIDSVQAKDVKDYRGNFIDTLSKLFVTKNEFKNLSSPAPNWVMYISGHGELAFSVAGISISEFQDFLTFLEKISTKLLVYSSCYAAGLNNQLIYADATGTVKKNFDFPIITIAIIDAITSTLELKIVFGGEKPTVELYENYACFIEKASSTEPDYIQAIKCINFDYFVENIAQIRFPGLEWFSVLDLHDAVAIGSIMASTRTAPLNIATFFAKEGSPASPLGILLYAQNIPFELIIDTKYLFDGVEQCYIPTFISMIQGNTIHTLKKISSSCNSLENILNGFYIRGLKSRKIYIIDKIEALLTQDMKSTLGMAKTRSDRITVSNIVIELKEDLINKYFTYRGKIYHTAEALNEHNQPTLATPESASAYYQLLKRYGQKSKPVTLKNSIKNTRSIADSLFGTKKVSSSDAAIHIEHLIAQMPNNFMLRMPSIMGKECPSENKSCWAFDFWKKIVQITPIGERKIIWFDELQVHNGSNSANSYKDIIIDIQPDATLVHYKNENLSEFNRAAFFHTTSNFPSFEMLYEDYLPKYLELFERFERTGSLENDNENSQGIEEKSLFKQHTPEALAKLKATLEKKIQAK